MTLLLLLIVIDLVAVGVIGGTYFFVTRRRLRERILIDHLAAITRKNLPLQTGLAELASDFGGSIGATLRRLDERIHAGQRLGEALGACGRDLPPILQSALIVGERSGNLAGFLNEAHRSAAAFEAARRRHEMFLFYPLIMALLISLLFGLVGTFIVPQFQSVFTDIGTGVPWPMRLWLKFGTQTALLLLLAVSVTIGLVWIGPNSLRRFTSPIRGLVDRLLLILPWIRRIELDSVMEQVAITLGIFLRAGARLPEAVRAAADLRINTAVKKRLDTMARHLEEGGSLQEFLRKDPLIPREFAWMVEIGGAGGTLDQQMLRAATVYAGRLRVSAYVAARLMIPIYVMLNGILVLSMAAGVFMVMRKVMEGPILW